MIVKMIFLKKKKKDDFKKNLSDNYWMCYKVDTNFI